MCTTANKMFAQWWGDVLVQSVIFVQRFVSGTGRGFESPPLRKHKRWAQLSLDNMNTTIELPNRKSWLLIVVFSILTLQMTAASILMILNFSDLPWYKNIFLLTIYAVSIFWLLRGLAWQYKGLRKISVVDNTLTFIESSPLTVKTMTFDLNKINGVRLTDHSEKEGPLAMAQLVGIVDRLSVSIIYNNKEVKLLKGNDIGELTSAKERLEKR
jgi:hypothetical protein